MRQASNIVALTTAALQTGKEIKHERPSPRWTPETGKLVSLLFARMADLFGPKCKTRGLEIYADEERGIHSQAFQLWCWKLNGLTAEQFARGMQQIEIRAREAYQVGDEMWPPSYAEFQALCCEHHDTRAHKYFPPMLALEDKTAREQRMAYGREQSAKLLAMFDKE